MDALTGKLAAMIAGRNGPVSSAIDERYAKVGGYYLGRRHGLIHRHVEQVALDLDQTARWRLTIDLALPSEREAECGRRDGKCLYLFPLMFLKKAEGRTNLHARDEQGTALPLLNRASCDWISGVAAAEAALRLADKETRRGISMLDCGDARDAEANASLRYVLQCVASQPPYDASVFLNELLNSVDEETFENWQAEGLSADLKMLVEHSLVWLPLRGLPGERRTIEIGHDWEPLPKPFLSWKIGQDKQRWLSRLRWRRRKRFKNPSLVLDTGDTRYGRLARRISFSVFGERLARPLAWMPIEFDFPTIYTRRCASYHFELICPNGLSPHGIKVAIDRREPGRAHTELEGGETLGARAAQIYLPGGRDLGDLLIRATVGIGRGAFPILWFLMGAITAGMLWAFAAVDPNELIGAKDSSNEIAAGILLIAPALLGALVVGAEQQTTQLISGARLLLLANGMACVLAATVLLGGEPFGLGSRAQWTACAALTTAATVPLASSWLLSSRLIWPRLKILNSTPRQYAALIALLLVAIGLVGALQEDAIEGLPRAVLATGLLAMTIPLVLLASNRFAVRIDEKRYFLALGAFAAALACLALGCIELRASFDLNAGFHEIAERWVLYALIAAPFAGGVTAWFTSHTHAKPGQVHVAPAVAKTLFDGKRIRELHKLRPSPTPERQDEHATSPEASYSRVQVDQRVAEEYVGTSEADWSTGLRSTVDLPSYLKGEFEHLVGQEPRTRVDPTLEQLEREIRENVAVHMEALRTAALGVEARSGG